MKEEDLISVFNSSAQAMALENAVEAVRIVRDSKTRVGKGIAYLLFKSKVAAIAALELNGFDCKGRKMRVSRVDKNADKKRTTEHHTDNKKQTNVKSSKLSGGA